MADGDDAEKTEDPTAKRQGEAREKGQVGKSREIDHWAMLMAMTLIVFIFAAPMAASLKQMLIMFLEMPHAIATDGNSLQTLFMNLAMQIGASLAPAVVLLVVAALGSSVAQHGILIAPDMLTPRLSKLSPLAGLKRLFNVNAVVEFVKGSLKIFLIGAFCYWLLKSDFDQLEKYVFFEPVQFAETVAKLGLKLLAGMLAFLSVVAALDFMYQKFQLQRQLRMSREEIREEFKQSEGDPAIKGRLRQLRVERARRRMMQEVPKSDVIVTNPTHYAVALKYDQDTMNAPKLLAKGADLIAQKIRDLAIEHNIPIVENPPLARSLYAAVEVDQEIPPEHYKVVAEIIGYVYRLRRGQVGQAIPNPPRPG
jgi:flagellar biosynthetic protein FlhB